VSQVQSVFKVTVQLGHVADWSGSIHDDSSAQNYGFQGALVPGPSLHGYLTRPAVERWGEEWLQRGTMSSHCRRPAYHLQELTVTGIVDAGDARRMSVTATDAKGDVVAYGEATLPVDRPALPAVAAFASIPFQQTLPVVAAGLIPIELRFMSKNEALTEKDHSDYLELLADTWPVYRQKELIHASYAMRLATHNGTRSFLAPTPGIYVTGWTQHLNTALVGDRLRTAGWVTNSFERKGNQYYETEEMVFANDSTPIALIRRSVIYAIRPKTTAVAA